MCGIVGLYLKSSELQPHLGEMFAPIQMEMTNRGPDSAGFAVYRDAVDGDQVKLTLAHPDEGFDWPGLVRALEAEVTKDVALKVVGNHAILVVGAAEDAVVACLDRQIAARGLRHIWRIAYDQLCLLPNQQIFSVARLQVCSRESGSTGKGERLCVTSRYCGSGRIQIEPEQRAVSLDPQQMQSNQSASRCQLGDAQWLSTWSSSRLSRMRERSFGCNHAQQGVLG